MGHYASEMCCPDCQRIPCSCPRLVAEHQQRIRDQQTALYKMVLGMYPSREPAPPKEDYASAEYASWDVKSRRYGAFINDCAYCINLECTMDIQQRKLEQDWKD